MVDFKSILMDKTLGIHAFTIIGGKLYLNTFKILSALCSNILADG